MKILRLVLILACLSAMAETLWAAPHNETGTAAGMPTKLAVTCWGAAGRVSGSLHVLDTGNACVMLDCGAFFADSGDEGTPRQAEQLSASLPVDAAGIDALLLTHVHSDHCGRIPLLVNSGFQGPIITTRASSLLLDPMLGGAVRFDRQQVRTWSWSERSRSKALATGRHLTVHWRPCRYARSIAEDNLATFTGCGEKLESHLVGLDPRLQPHYCSACVQAEVDAILLHVRIAEYREPIRLAPGVRAGLLRAGHLPGSASVVIEVELDGRRLRILFSGDLGSELSPVLAGPQPASNVDAVFVEATYGATRRPPDIVQQRASFRRQVGEAIERGGVVWIPCFALDRTQRILHELHLAQQEGRLPESLPIYCPSPTAKAITAIYRENQRAGWFRDEVTSEPNAFAPREVLTTVPSYEKLPKPCIVISTSDITYTAWMRMLLRKLLPEPSTAVMLVGYCEPSGATGRLEAGVKELTIDGRATPVAARVHSFGCFSGHGDATDIDRWLGNIDPAAPIFLVHGGPEELQARASQLRQCGRKDVRTAERGVPVDLAAIVRGVREQ